MAQSERSAKGNSSQAKESKSRASGGRSGASTKGSAPRAGARGEEMSDLKAQGQEIASQAQEQAASLVSMAREQATSQFGVQKERASGTLTALATALHDASREMRKEDTGPIADYVDTAASQVEQFATVLRDQDIDQLIATTEQFARRQPALFLAAAFGLGFAGSRFLKSSSQAARGQSGVSGYGSFADRSDWQRTGISSGAWSAQGEAGSEFGTGWGSESRGERYGTASAGTATGADWQSRSSMSRGSEGQ
jgi:hypothetical protein